MDGTACDATGHLSENTKEALNELHSRGHLICFITGRRDMDMAPFWEDAQYADYLLMNNGGKLMLPKSREILFQSYVPKETAERLIFFCLKENLQLHVLGNNSWYVNKWSQGLQDYTDYLGVRPKLYSDLSQLDTAHIEGFYVTDDAVAVCEFMRAQNLPLSYALSEDNCVDIMPRQVNKRSGLAQLGEMLNIPKEDMVAAGDYENDIPMLRYAGVGVAVANALPSVKAAADYVTVRRHDEDAVLEIIEKFF